MFQNKNHVKETEQNKRTSSGQSDISTLKDSQTSRVEIFDKTFTTAKLPEKLWILIEEETTARRQEV